MGKKLTTSEFIERARQVHGDTYDYTQTSYVSSSTKVSIICKTHGIFEQWPSDHLRGSGCRLCNERQQMTTEQFVERAAAKHHGKYDYSQSKYVNTNTKLVIICPIHGEYKQVAKDHLAGYGCPNCGGTGKKTTHEFIESAQKAHGDKYDYSLVDLKSMNKKVKIVCRDHGEFMQRPADHVDGSGCPECGKLKQGGYTSDYFVNHNHLKSIPAKLYLIEIDSKFCKIGITTKQYVKQRFPGMRFIEHAVQNMTLQDAFCAEQQILQQFSDSRYLVQDFRLDKYQTGWTECFPLSMLEELKMAVEACND